MVVLPLSQLFHHLFKVKRSDVHEFEAHSSSRTRRIPPRYVWQTEQIAKDTDERHPVANGNDDRIHRHWGWVPISGQLFGGGVLVFLLFNCAWASHTAGKRAKPREVRLTQTLIDFS
jgi:hypothetical protein